MAWRGIRACQLSACASASPLTSSSATAVSRPGSHSRCRHSNPVAELESMNPIPRDLPGEIRFTAVTMLPLRCGRRSGPILSSC
jgi:hypothetical protein